MKVLVLGGYGAVGFETAKRLLLRTDAEVVIAGRSIEKAESAVARLSEETGGDRVSGRLVDASNHDDLVSAFKTADWVVVCIPLAGLGGGVARAAYDAGVHYIDINANREKQVYLQTMAARIKERGLVFVTEAGLGPGVPSLLVRYAHEQLGRLETVDVASIFRDSTVSRGSARDMLVALGERHRVFKNGAWREAPVTSTKEIDFGAAYGRHRCYPFEFLELAKLPVEDLGVSELGFYAAGFNAVIDLLVWVWMTTGLYRIGVGLRLGTRIAMWAGRFTKPPFCTLIQVDATTPNGSRIRVGLGHEDAYVATAIPLTACVIQMVGLGLAHQPGLHLMGHLLRTDRFLADLESMGMNVTVERREPAGRESGAVISCHGPGREVRATRPEPRSASAPPLARSDGKEAFS